MRIAQITLPAASEYERKSQRADHAALSERHEVIVTSIDAIRDIQADLAHIYANGELPAAAFVGFPLPYLASNDVRHSKWSWRRPVPPRCVVSPLGEDPLPEAVEEGYFAPAVNRHAANRQTGDPQQKIVGSFGRPSVRNSVEQTMARIRRFRTDVDWQVFEQPPTPEDLASVDVWVDPAIDENDYDGFTAEALVVGLPVVATRTAINVLRLEQGRIGFLVPPRDPNEMTHVILSALFKTEVAENRQFAARQTVSKFRARQRLRILNRLYDIVKNT
jgi:glycosyltransferase involved in cell wall biosynthesis